MAKADRIVVRLESDVRPKLHAAASALGLDDAAYVRMLIYRSINSAESEVMHHRSEYGPAVSALPHNAQPLVAPEPPGADEPEPLPVPEMEIPADPDDDQGFPAESLDDLLRAGPSLLDEMMAAETPAPAGARMLADIAAPRAPARSYRQPNHQVVPFGRPGSLTRPIGINDGAVGGGDRTPQGANVLRENMRHFGVGGTRFR